MGTDQVPQIQAGMQSLAAVCIGVAAVAAVMVTGQITSVPGIPGQDYPTLDFYNLPSTSFDCGGRGNGGFYSDEEAFCQVRENMNKNNIHRSILFLIQCFRCIICVLGSLREDLRNFLFFVQMEQSLIRKSWSV